MLFHLQSPRVLCPPRAAGHRGHACSVFPSVCAPENLPSFYWTPSVSRCESSPIISSLRLSAPLCHLHIAGLGGQGEPAQESRLESLPRSRVLALQPGGDLPKLMSLRTSLQPANSLPDCSQNRDTALSSTHYLASVFCPSN